MPRLFESTYPLRSRATLNAGHRVAQRRLQAIDLGGQPRDFVSRSLEPLAPGEHAVFAFLLLQEHGSGWRQVRTLERPLGLGAPAGIAIDPGPGRPQGLAFDTTTRHLQVLSPRDLWIGDGEVDEMSIYQGAQV